MIHVFISNLRKLQTIFLAYSVLEAIISSSLEILWVAVHSLRLDQECLIAWIGQHVHSLTKSKQGV
jgi:hypothetical protein